MSLTKGGKRVKNCPSTAGLSLIWLETRILFNLLNYILLKQILSSRRLYHIGIFTDKSLCPFIPTDLFRGGTDGGCLRVARP